MSDEDKPRPYDLTQPAEVDRLMLETRGYLHTCRNEHHGTDFEGRMYAQDGLASLAATVASLKHSLDTVREEERERAAKIADDYAFDMHEVAASRHNQSLHEEAHQHEAAREACKVVAELIRTPPPSQSIRSTEGA